jgi:hypothetical protein
MIYSPKKPHNKAMNRSGFGRSPHGKSTVRPVIAGRYPSDLFGNVMRTVFDSLRLFVNTTYTRMTG